MSADVPTITIRANTRLVVVDVVVTDKKGQPITGLKPEGFTAEENGKKQKISVFVPPGVTNQTAYAPAPPGILSNHPENVMPAGAPTVLLLDAANSSFSNQAYARSEMLKYVVGQARSGHPMAVLTLTDRLHVLQQFTSDPEVLITAIKNLRPEQPILQPGAKPQDASSANDVALTQAAAGSRRESARSCLWATIATAVRAIQDFANIELQYALDRRTLITIGALQELSRMLGGLPGRKNVVWLTASLPFDLIPETSVSDEELMADLPASSRNLLVPSRAAPLHRSSGLVGQQIREVESQLASANIAIYPVDLNGLISGMEGSATSPALRPRHPTQRHGLGSSFQPAVQP